MPLPIPDALVADLKDYFLSAQPGMNLPPDSVRQKFEQEEIPSPRLVITAGEPKPVRGMDGTARIVIALDYITNLDRVTPEAHRATSGKLDGWLREIKSAKRRDLIATRCYLHDIYTNHPVIELRATEREQQTTIRGEIICTLVA